MRSISSLIIAGAAVSALSLTSCKDKTEEPELPAPSRTILVYAVASNNLYPDLVDNKKAMLKGMENVDLKHNNLLLYEVNNQSATRDRAILYQVERQADGSLGFVEKKSYSRDIYSTDPVRVKEVTGEISQIAPADNYDLFFWSHGTGWTPAGTKYHPDFQTAYSFGYDTDKGRDDRCDINELAAAVPDGMFDAVWFDACYMSSIETIAEFEGKCDYFVAYPTEIWSAGLPYDKALPHLYGSPRNIASAAATISDYYSAAGRAYTVGVFNMSMLGDVEEKAAAVYREAAELPKADTASLLDYARRPYGPFYDLIQYSRWMTEADPGCTSAKELEKALDAFTVYKSASEKNFSNKPIDPEAYSAISVHPFDDDGCSESEFYKTLKWYKKVICR